MDCHCFPHACLDCHQKAPSVGFLQRLDLIKSLATLTAVQPLCDEGAEWLLVEETCAQMHAGSWKQDEEWEEAPELTARSEVVQTPPQHPRSPISFLTQTHTHTHRKSMSHCTLCPSDTAHAQNPSHMHAHTHTCEHTHTHQLNTPCNHHPPLSQELSSSGHSQPPSTA